MGTHALVRGISNGRYSPPRNGGRPWLSIETSRCSKPRSLPTSVRYLPVVVALSDLQRIAGLGHVRICETFGHIGPPALLQAIRFAARRDGPTRLGTVLRATRLLLGSVSSPRLGYLAHWSMGKLTNGSLPAFCLSVPWVAFLP